MVSVAHGKIQPAAGLLQTLQRAKALSVPLLLHMLAADVPSAEHE